jgi:diguanylate cyclase (GGDEF)-like protein
MSAPLSPAAAAGVTIEMLEAELQSARRLHLEFAPPLETLFGKIGRRQRTRSIIVNMFIAMTMLCLFCLVIAPYLIPDITGAVLWGPVGCLTAGGTLIVNLCRGRSANVREALLAPLMVFATVSVSGWVTLSRAPDAFYAMMNILLISVFANIMLRLRFRWAWMFSLVTLIATALAILDHPEQPPAIRLDAVYAVVSGIVFSLVANNQLERGARRSFLLAMMETLRADQLREDREMFSTMSMVDALTGLANRRAFDVRLAELVRQHDAGGDPFALLICDIDYFKSFNDSYGHLAGDACLAQVGLVLRQTGRAQDMVARYGGEEFAILLPGCDATPAVRVAQTVCSEVAEAGISHLGREDAQSVVTISIGVAVANDGNRGVSGSEMINQADRNLYAAKRAGRNCIRHTVLGQSVDAEP